MITLGTSLTWCSGTGRLRTMTLNVTNVNENTVYTTSTDVSLPPRLKSAPDIQRLPTVIPSTLDVEPSKPFYYLNNKHKIVAAGLLCSYGALISLLWWYEWHIWHGSGWSCWKEDISISITDLSNDEQRLLARELLSDIKKYYAAEYDPLISFMSHVEAEYIRLKNFLGIRKLLETIKFSYVLPGQQQTIAHAHTKLERLVYLRKLVMGCLREYSDDEIHL